jgi:putative nucleotidyltransferase with HDIG domain
MSKSPINLKIPECVSQVTQKLEEAGFEAFLVGGCVRDHLMGVIPKDYDVTTSATPTEIIALFGEDQTFYDNPFGTVGIKTESEDSSLKIIEVTPYRLESDYSDNRHPDSVTFSQKIEDDLSRRDFTINALAYSPSQRQLIDLYDGIKDIEEKRIKTVGNPDSRFKEDALRLMRAIRFAAQLNFVIEKDTFSSIYVNRETLKYVSRERIKDEFSKVLMTKNPSTGIFLLLQSGLLEYISKDLVNSVGVSQNKQAHLYDVFEHLVRSMQYGADQDFSFEIRLAALFHDIAKPHTKRTNNGKTTFFGHEVVGERVTRVTLDSLKFSRETIDYVCLLIRWHMFFSDPDQITLTAVRRMLARVGETSMWDLIKLRQCDRIGSGRPNANPYRLRKYVSMVEEALKDPVSLKMLKVDGVLLMKHGFAPGKQLGNVLYVLFDEVLEDPVKNTEEYLVTRATQLQSLSEKEIALMAQKGKDALKKENDEQVADIRKKYKVE